MNAVSTAPPENDEPIRATDGLRVLLGPSSPSRLGMILMGSISVSFLEVVGLLAIVPLVQLLSSTDDTTGLLARMEEWFGHPSRSRLALILSLFVMGSFIAKAVFVVIFRWWANGYIFGQEARTTTDLLDRYMRAPYWIHLERNSAEFLRTLMDSIAQAYSSYVMGTVNFLTEAVVATAIVVVLIVIQPVAAIAAGLYFFIAGFIYARLISKRSTEAGRVLSEQSMRSLKTANQALGGVKEVKIRNRHAYFVDQYSAARYEMAKAKRLASFLTEFPKYVLEVIFITGVGLLSLVVVSRSTSQDVLGLLALFVAAGFRLLPSLIKMMASFSSIRTGRRGFDLVVSDLLAFPDTLSDFDVDFNPEPMPIEKELVVDKVSFSYASSEIPVLNEVSFTLNCGESLGVVGASGAGKSTLVDILLGLHLPSSGRLLADGSDVVTNMPGWQSGIGLVPQDVYLIDDTLSANIAFGVDASEIDNELLREVVIQSQLSHFVESLPLGMESIVGERGVRISGGQRQRIGIARSLYSRPNLLILDEATSALDNETELRISETIESLHGTLTMIVVAHRLSTIRKCDRILFLESGTVRDIGSFDELVERDPEFASLARLAQINAPEPEPRETIAPLS